MTGATSRGPAGHVLEVAGVLSMVNKIGPIPVEAMAGLPGDDQDAIIGICTELEQEGRLPSQVAASHMVKGPPIEQSRALRINAELMQARVLKIVGNGTF